MPSTERYGEYGFPICLFLHCLLCGQHYEGINHYCKTCMASRYDEVERDAKIRSYSRKWTTPAVCTHTADKE